MFEQSVRLMQSHTAYYIFTHLKCKNVKKVIYYHRTLQLIEKFENNREYVYVLMVNLKK